jgi:Domain of unknown function (DUF397)
MIKPNTAFDASSISWRKSIRSQGAGACVEIATFGETIGIRDSRSAHKNLLTFTSHQWGNFIRHSKKHREFNL